MAAKLSEVRRQIAQEVNEGRVSYRPGEAQWYIDGEMIGGPRGRSVREMTREGLIVMVVPERIDADTAVTATLSPEAIEALSEAATS
jgi:hypothetical protein